MKTKTILLESDFHCGDAVGIWHPAYEYSVVGEPIPINETQETIYNLRRDVLREYGYFDCYVNLGDMVEGRINGEPRIHCADRLKQAECAGKLIAEVKAKKKFLIHGTGRHVMTESGENCEHVAAMAAGKGVVKNNHGELIHDFVALDINGALIHCRHFVGSSAVPYGGLTPIYREAIWNAVNHAYTGERPANLLARGHIHRYERGSNGHTDFVTLPALKARGCRHGNTKCTGRVDVGVVVLIVDGSGEITVRPHIRTVKNPHSKIHVV